MFSTHRSPDPIKDRAHPSTRRSSSELLRSGSSPFILRRTARLPLGSVPSSRHHRKAATFFREASRAPLRSVLRFSQPLDGFFCSPACELVSSRNHVQGSSSFRGFSPDVAVPSSSEGASSLPLLHRRSPTRSDFRRLELSSTYDASRLRGLHPRQAAFTRVWLFTAPKVAPLIEFLAPPGPRSLDDDLRSHGDHPLLMLRAGLRLRADQSNAHVRVHVPTSACSLERHVRVWAFRRTRSCIDRARILESLGDSNSPQLLP
jgi:hypothetical protein